MFGQLMLFAGVLLLPFSIAAKWNKFTMRQKALFISFWVGMVLVPTGVIMRYFQLPGYDRVFIIGFVLLLLCVLYYVGILLSATFRTTPIGQPLSSEALTQNGMTSADLKQYQGRYTNSKLPLQIAIRETDGALIAQATEQSAFYLEIVEKGVFKYWKRDIVLDFNTEKNELILRQHGGYFPFLKEAEPSAN